DEYGNTPLMNAARHGHVHVARLLFQLPDIDPNKQDSAGRTAFLIAAGSKIAESQSPDQEGGNPLLEEMLRHPAVRS
ncbi:ankyrin repeat domain-containing protein, partial [Salmonella enterica]|uniref:ankyrin repeat domain-containing protein n=1 Tax=Salmonella enterica TaxID=28901 RepID=UPI0034D244E4